MLCLSLPCENHSLIDCEIERNQGKTSLIELRLDYLEKIDIELLRKIIKKYRKLKFIFTLRSQEQGGSFPCSENERKKILVLLSEIRPHYMDLEYDVDPQIIEKVKKKTAVILSYHNFEKFEPKQLKALYLAAKNNPDIDYKFAAKADALETLLLLIFLQEHPLKNLTIVPMSSAGSFGRVFAKVFSNPVTYVYSHAKTAEGQIHIDDMINIYNFNKINKKTAVYALLGDPIDLSIGHIFHNEKFAKMKKNALYLKINVVKEKLKEFLSLALKLPFVGFSVTTPLKEETAKYLDADFSKIGVVNTIKVMDGKLLGYNTDGIGAVMALAKYKIQEPILIIGAGATAKSIAFQLKKKYQKIYIFNRTEEKAKKLAKELNIFQFIHERKFKTVINATSASRKNILPNSLENLSFQKGQVVFDVANSKDTIFLEYAKKRKAKTVSGREMFVFQAMEQHKIWFKNRC